MLSDEMKAERVRISRELLERFEKEGEVMKLGSIIMTLRTKGSPWNTAIRNHLSRKKFKTCLSWKGHIDSLWNSERVFLAGFLEKETTINLNVTLGLLLP